MLQLIFQEVLRDIDDINESSAMKRGYEERIKFSQCDTYLIIFFISGVPNYQER